MIDDKGRETNTVVEAYLYGLLDQATDTIKECQRLLLEHIIPNSTVTADKTITSLLTVLDNPEVVKLLDELA